MDLSNRNAQPTANQPATAAGSTGSARKSNTSDDGKLKRVGLVVLAALAAILLLSAAVAAASGKDANESKYVDDSKLQAVFLNTGQVYFGKIKELNSKYFVVSNIYYLQTSAGGQAANSQAANTSVSLVKLGCELHEPFDQMVINRDQVTFWENLQDNGQVAQAVKTFVKQNPNGQKCADQSSSAGTDSTNSVQSAGNNSSTPATGNTPGTTAPNTGAGTPAPRTNP